MNSDNDTNQRTATQQTLPFLPLLTTCTTGFTTEYCWAAGEAVLVPYLSRHGVQPWVVSMIYLSNPTVGLWIQPLLGRWSDVLNRRVVFVIALGIGGCFGVVLLLCAMTISQALGLSDNDNFSDSVITISFIGFGISDICYDCLLIPGRALLDDLAVPLGRSEESNALFTGFQLVGRLIALLVVSSNMTTSGFWGLLDGVDGHFDAVILTNVACLFCMMGVVSLFVTDTGSRQDVNDHGFAAVDEAEQLLQRQKESPVTKGECNDKCDGNSLQLSHASNTTNYQTLSILSDKGRQSDNSSNGHNILQSIISCIYTPEPTVLLFAIQTVGWIAITAQSFFWTSWRGEQIGSIDLALQGLVGIITSALLPIANRHIGAATVWCASELFFHLLMMNVAFVNVESFTSRIISALCGINYAIHATNGLLVAADIVADASKRARTIAMVNNALPAGQLVTALFGGMIAQYFDGFRSVFVCFGCVGAVVTGLVWIVSSRQGLFTRVCS